METGYIESISWEDAMTNWVEKGYGATVFEHEKWEVWIQSPQRNNRIEVFPPHNGEEVEVYPEGIWVRGASDGSWHEQPEAFTIPWPVIAAIIEARAIVAEREKVSG
ncbi:hypothetical protein EB061_09295 [bacterium]|nr:hypothetical protein [bacterium]